MGEPLVLIVEDSALSAGLLADLVVLAGGQAQVVRHGAAALASVVAAVPRLVIMDLRLPDGDGADWACHLKALPGMAQVPIWACSGALPDDMLATAWDDQPFDGWMAKPFDVGEVLQKLRRILLV